MWNWRILLGLATNILNYLFIYSLRSLERWVLFNFLLSLIKFWNNYLFARYELLWERDAHPFIEKNDITLAKIKGLKAFVLGFANSYTVLLFRQILAIFIFISSVFWSDLRWSNLNFCTNFILIIWHHITSCYKSTASPTKCK